MSFQPPKPDDPSSCLEQLPPEALLEKDLRDFLATHLSATFGEQLTLLGTEFPCNVGRIDLLAKDSAGTIWVIELKNRPCSRDVVGQLQSYMGAVRKRYPSSAIRGVVVGPAFDESALSALSETFNIVFFSFRVRYTVAESARSPNLLPPIASSAPSREFDTQKWIIDVDKRIIFLRANTRDSVSLDAVHVIPGLGIAFANLLAPFAEIELIGDGYSVGQFRKTIVKGSVPDFTLPSTPSRRKRRTD